MTKAELRKMYKARRSSLSEAEIRSLNAGVMDQLLRLDWKGVRYIHAFLPILGQHEPDMWPFITYVRKQGNIQLVLSQIEPKDSSMRHVLFTEHTELVDNAWGITEPVSGQQVAETLLDAVLVPLLIADRCGNRVGYGKGFYDRFLAKCRPDCRKIGISFFDPVDEIADVETSDIPLDMLVTPFSTMRF